MEYYVDSSDWVMAPNVYGMGLYSDGGIFLLNHIYVVQLYFKNVRLQKG